MSLAFMNIQVLVSRLRNHLSQSSCTYLACFAGRGQGEADFGYMLTYLLMSKFTEAYNSMTPEYLENIHLCGLNFQNIISSKCHLLDIMTKREIGIINSRTEIHSLPLMPLKRRVHVQAIWPKGTYIFPYLRHFCFSFAAVGPPAWMH
jgi:hypothetical protein